MEDYLLDYFFNFIGYDSIKHNILDKEFIKCQVLIFKDSLVSFTMLQRALQLIHIGTRYISFFAIII